MSEFKLFKNAARKQKRQEILEILDHKEKADLQGKSKEELEAMLNSL